MMASSGSITTNEQIQRSITLSWSLVSQSIEDNTSTINWNLKGSGPGTQWVMSGGFKVIINGAVVYSTSTDNRIQLLNGTLIASGQVKITHNLDGTKVFGLSCEAGIYTYAVSVRASGTHTLKTIPRASNVAATNTEMNAKSTITINRASSAFTHTLTYSFGGVTGTIVSKTTSTSISWSPPLTLASQIPNAISGICTITCDTYSGSSKIGSKNCTLKLTVPDSVKPSIGSLEISKVDGSVPVAWNIYIQSKSKATLTIKSPSGVYGSTISSYYISGGGYSSTSANFTTGFLVNSGKIAFTATVTDSRGRTSDDKTIYIDVLPYEPPSYTSYLSQRANRDGILNDDGLYIKGIVDFTYSTCNNKNRVTCSTYYKKTSDLQWVNANTNFATNAAFIFGNGEISTEYSYDIKYVISDAFSTITILDSVSTAAVLMDFKAGGKGIAIGKVSEKEKSLELAPDWDLIIHSKNIIDLIYPVGSVFVSVNSISPNILFKGTNWQSFSSGRTLVGVDENNSNFNTIEKTGGIADVTLSVSQIPSHTHSASSSKTGMHRHKVSYGSNGPVASGYPDCVMYGWKGGLNPNNATWDYGQMNAGDHSHAIDVKYTGGNSSHTNLQPYITVYMWKRVS